MGPEPAIGIEVAKFFYFLPARKMQNTRIFGTINIGGRIYRGNIERSMVLFERKKKILACAHNSDARNLSPINRIHFRFCHRSFHLHPILRILVQGCPQFKRCR